MKKAAVISSLLVYFTVTSLTAGGPWTQPKGKGFFKLAELWIIFDQHYTDAGLLDPNVTTGLFNSTLYTEYGFTDRFTGIFNGAIFSRTYMNNLVSGTTGEVLVPGEALNSIGDMDLGLKYSLTKPGSKVPVAASLYFGIPTGATNKGDLGNLQTGDGEFNQLLQIDIGKGFNIGKKVSSYVSANIGFNHRTNGYSEEFRYGLEYGLGFFNQRLWATGRLIGVESLKNGNTAASNTSTSIFSNNTEYTSYSFEVSSYLLKKAGLSFSYAGAFRGEIIAAAPTYSVGIFYDMSK